MKLNRTIIIGAGIAGLGASYALRNRGEQPLILEKDSTYGGLCGSFETVEGFRFDRFVHLSFSQNIRANKIFIESTAGNIIPHIPNPYNIYNRQWIKHPAQNNLYPLTIEEKNEIIKDFRNRPVLIDQSQISDYEQWLRMQYGNAFAERFPIVYTRKYWMTEARELETKWIGNRLYQPSLDEVIRGASTNETPITYYAKEMHYPSHGGYKTFLKTLVDGADIRFNSNVIEINPKDKTIKCNDGKSYKYSRLISSMPLPLLINALPNIPESVNEATSQLRCSTGYQVSIALKGNKIPPYLWWYIYDMDILPARVYSPSLKSADNAPNGCSSLQLEIYCKKNQFTQQELIEKSIKPLIEMGIISQEDIIDIDLRFEPWANVIFDHNIYEVREKVLDYVRSLNIEPIGRFGLWDYLWSDQALLSGLNIE